MKNSIVILMVLVGLTSGYAQVKDSTRTEKPKYGYHSSPDKRAGHHQGVPSHHRQAHHRKEQARATRPSHASHNRNHEEKERRPNK